MKYLIFILALSIQFNVKADTLKMIERDRSMNLVASELSFSSLALDDNAESFKYFKIIKGISEEEKPFSQLSEKEKFRVVTLGFHLSKARDYFTRVLKADFLNKEDKITIRYEMARSFSSGKHFTPLDNEYNNAVTNKASNQYVLADIKKWETEIWFRPALDEVQHAPRGMVQQGNFQNELLNLADTAVVDLTKEASLGLGTQAFDVEHYASQIGLLLLMKKIVPTILDFTISSLPFKVNLDSAMIPEIIYHEFTHVAMSDFVPLTGSFAVSEGMANYFASVISGNTQIAGKLGEYGKNIEPLKINKNIKYSSNYEVDSNLAHHPFTYNYLWIMRDRVSKEISIENLNSAEVFDRIVYESRKYIDFASDLTISKSLPEALKKATTTIGLEKFTARDIRLIIAQTAQKVGM